MRRSTTFSIACSNLTPCQDYRQERESNDVFFGEELLAVVIPKAGEQLTEQELRNYCKGQISHQKIPRYIQFVESYALTASGKVQKFVLREQAIKTLELEEVAKTRTA